MVKRRPELILLSRGRSEHPCAVFVHGFLAASDRKDDYRTWREALRQAGHKGPIYAFTWPSGHALKLAGIVFAPLALGPTSRISARLLGGALGGSRFWRSVSETVETQAAALADHLRGFEQTVDLYAHSLGSAVALHATAHAPTVRNVVTFGAAVEKGSDWEVAADRVSGAVVNVFSTRDTVLQVAFRGGQRLSGLGPGRAAGRRLLSDTPGFDGLLGELVSNPRHDRLYDLDSSHLVGSHFDYAANAGVVLGSIARSIGLRVSNSNVAEARNALRENIRALRRSGQGNDS